MAALAALIGLGGCADTSQPSATALAPTVAPADATNDVSLADVPVAIVSLRGAPDGPTQDFNAAMQRELTVRGVAAAPEKSARYVVRGWLSARSGAEEATFGYVFDVYDRAHVRVARLDAGFAVKGTGDAWSLMTPEALNTIAVQGADDIAQFLRRNAPAQTPAPAALSYAADHPL